MMRVQFKATKSVPVWNDRHGKWRDGEVKEFGDDVGRHLINTYPNLHEYKQVIPSEDKMMKGASENKTVNVDTDGKIKKGGAISTQSMKTPRSWRRKRK